MGWFDAKEKGRVELADVGSSLDEIERVLDRLIRLEELEDNESTRESKNYVRSLLVALGRPALGEEGEE